MRGLIWKDFLVMRKGLYVYVPLCVGCYALLAWLGTLNWLNDLSPSSLIGGAALLPLGVLVLLFISYLISCRVVAGKEY